MLRWAVLLVAGCDGVFGIQHILIVDAAAPDAATGYRGTILGDHPVGYWPLDEASGVVAHDLAGSHDGQYEGTGLLLGADPPFPSAISAASFDGQSAEVDLGDNFGFPGNAPYTVEAWFSPNYFDTREYYEIVAKWREPSATDPTGWNVYYSHSEMSRLQYSREAVGHVTSSDRLEASYAPGWHYVAATMDDQTQTMRLYYDGVQAASTGVTFGLDSIPEHLVIGAANHGPTDVTMYGSIGQVAIYDYVLTPTQISQHYDARSI